jgi:hypothetical protein
LRSVVVAGGVVAGGVTVGGVTVGGVTAGGVTPVFVSTAVLVLELVATPVLGSTVTPAPVV